MALLRLKHASPDEDGREVVVGHLGNRSERAEYDVHEFHMGEDRYTLDALEAIGIVYNEFPKDCRQFKPEHYILMDYLRRRPQHGKVVQVPARALHREPADEAVPGGGHRRLCDNRAALCPPPVCVCVARRPHKDTPTDQHPTHSSPQTRAFDV